MWDGDLTGEVLDGRYALGNLYGSGGMAEVYRGFDTRLDRKVAIKFFQGEATGEDRIRLDREAQVLGAMRCPGLVEVYDTGVHRGRPYFVMQPIEGGTLRRRMRGALAPEVVATIGAQVAGVLAHVHSHDVVHRDVKPSNILLDTGGRRAYLADFGLALQAQVTRVTRSGMLVGTAGYLAPEQVRGADVRPSADVYALGLVLLECLTGRPEYPGGDTEAALSRLHREPRIPANLPESWTSVLTAMTASDPTKRPSAAECERLLTVAGRASAGVPPLVEVAVTDRPAPADGPDPADRPASPAGRRIGGRLLLGGAAVAAAALTLLAAVTLNDAPPPESGHAPGGTTTGAAEPVAEQAQQTTGAVVPGNQSPATVSAVGGAPPPSGTTTTVRDGAAAPEDGGEDKVDDTNPSKTKKETPLPVELTPQVRTTPDVPTPVVEPPIGPPSKGRGGASAKG